MLQRAIQESQRLDREQRAKDTFAQLQRDTEAALASQREAAAAAAETQQVATEREAPQRIKKKT